MKYITKVKDVTFEIEILPDGDLVVNGERRSVDFMAFQDTALYSVLMDNLSHEALVEGNNGSYEVLMHGQLFTVEVMDEREQLLSSHRSAQKVESGELSIKAPMPGLIVKIPVAEGEEVKAGQTVVILESMKMQNELKTPRDGVVQRVSVTAGQSVEQNKVLVTIV